MTISEFENTWTDKIKSEMLQSFPSDFIKRKKCKDFQMPGKPLVKGPELFGNFEIIDINGKTFIQTDNIYKLKYILYANKNIPKKILFPIDETELKLSVKHYEEHIDDLIKKVEKNYKKVFSSNKDLHSTSNKIFSFLNLSRY